MAVPGRGLVLDDISRAIIEQLQEDGRRPYARIAAAVGLSEAAVRQRVQRLLDAGVMQIVAVTDPLQVGFSRQAMVGVRTRGDARTVADALAEFDEIDYVVITAGSVDLLVETVCEDDDQLLDIVSRIRATEGVESTETFMYLGLRKQTYAWGTRPPRAVRRRLSSSVAAAGAGRNVEGGVAVEEAPRLQRERDRVHRHDRPVLGPRDVVDAEDVPQHDVGVGDRAVGLRPRR